VAATFSGRQLSVGEPYFNRMAAPIGLALLFLMAVAPVLPWRRASRAVLHRRLAGPAWMAAGTMAALAVAGVRGVAEVAAFGLATFAVAVAGRNLVAAVAARRRATGEGRWRALRATVGGNRRLYGGLVVHLGVVVVAVALAASKGYAHRAEVSLARGQTVTVDRYHLTYVGSLVHSGPAKLTVSARLRVSRGDRPLGTYAPALSVFPGATEAIGTPSVRTGPLEDLYLTLVSSPNDAGQVTVGVFVNPLVVWLWIGGAVMALGTMAAAWPSRSRPVGRRLAARPGQDEPADAPVELEVPA
jgi:cytochrome c-type biogenesis protein CcmF